MYMLIAILLISGISSEQMTILTISGYTSVKRTHLGTAVPLYETEGRRKSRKRRCMGGSDTGSMLYIARVNEEEPWKLTGDPVLLSRPLYGWENLEGTINNEGPYALVRDAHILLGGR